MAPRAPRPPAGDRPPRPTPGGPTLDHALRPARIGSLELEGRIVMGAMHLGIEAEPDAGPRLAAFYVERVRGGASLVVTGGAAVSRVGAGGRAYGLINEDTGQRAYARVAAAIREAGGRSCLQLFHAGRYAFPAAFGLDPVAPSAVASRFNRVTPVALDEAGIRATLSDFAAAAGRGRELGFDAVEIMGSEGYLVDQFLSPLTNRRHDGWGGDAGRRARFGLELLAAVRGAVGADFPVLFRLTGRDLMADSTTPEEALRFAAALADAGADALNVGIGWHEARVPTVQQAVPAGTWVPVARAVRAVTGDVPVIAGNRINRLADAEWVLADGGVDFVSMARPFLADPAIVAKARAGDGRAVNVCIACNQACIDRSIVGEPVSCLVNPRAGREHALPAPDARAARPGRFVVVGGGPAGLEAARALGALGHATELWEAAGELGGQFRLARRVPGKEDYDATIAYFRAELARLGVVVRLGRETRPEDLEALDPGCGVILATGVRPRVVDLPGRELADVLAYDEAFAPDPRRLGRTAIVGGGGIAVDLAHRIAEAYAPPRGPSRFLREHRVVLPGASPSPARGGRPLPAQGATRDAEDAGEPPPAADRPRPAITLMRRGGRIGAGLGRTTRWTALDALRRAGVTMLGGVAYEEIEPAGVRIVDADGARRLVAADTVVLAAGQTPHDPLSATAARLGLRHRVVGGARDALELDAVRAFAEGLRAAHELGG